jgi:antitoxin (DNA-binding transcriptional repressor) of toxin-antitoxin stability system
MAKRYIKVSDSKDVSIIPQSDFTMKDLELIEEFKDSGMLGLHTLAETDVERMMALYMDGKSYRQIASLLKKNKSIILFLAHKFKWFEIRTEYLEELNASLKGKIIEAKLQDQEFLLHLSLAYKKKIGKNIDQYLRTDDSKFYDQIDNKDLGTLMKVMEMLHKLSSENLGEKPPLVGLSGMSEGVTITKTGANSVDITPKKSGFSSKLKQFAELKRQEEKKQNSPQSNDIDKESEKPNETESDQ